ncbi:lactadherin [Anabrus simplex]|uniref:lactadherin n=1 Tax=Anabrus simplex TaxID=316456 RepID=UPI0035A3482F
MRIGARVLVLLYNLLLQWKHSAGECARPLGLTTGAVRDWQLSASSTLPQDLDPECHVRYARLHQPRGRAWCARTKTPDHWLLVDLGVAAEVTGVMTQGRADRDEWVTAFSLSYSQDAFRWDFTVDVDGQRKVYSGNSDAHSVRHNYVEPPITARFIRIHVLEWNRHPSLRLEVVGCQECNQLISNPPFTKITASSYYPWIRKNSCQPEDAHIFTHRAWCARHMNEHQWLQFDLGPPAQVVGVLTKGRPDTKRHQWVTSYTISYSNDSVVWYSYKEGNHLHPKVFGGNMDRSTERRHYLNQPFTARFVRIHPYTWHHAIALRAGLIGCPHHGECGQGFLRVTPLSRCVANLAYRKPTWVNDRRHGWKDWHYGNAALAVDGSSDTVLARCAILDNYYVDQPVWMVDLGWKEDVSGVILTTWQGAGQDKVMVYHDYLYNLDHLTVYVSNRPRLESYQLTLSPDGNVTRCAVISRANNALFRERLHFDCGTTLPGRFVYITASGVPNRWTQLYTAVFCEVEVY